MIVDIFLLPIGLGLLGFVEPCAIGAHLAFVGTLSEKSRSARVVSTAAFAAARTITMGALGVVAALLGDSFAVTQRTFWLAFGLGYLALGSLYVVGMATKVMARIGPEPDPSHAGRGPVALGLLFGLGIPACAAPLLFAATGAAAGAATVTSAFVSMALFGLALSVPLVALIAIPRLTETLRGAAARGRSLRIFIGLALIAVGSWSVWFGLFIDPTEWR